MMNSKGFGRKGSGFGLMFKVLSALDWKDWGKTRKTSVSVAG